MLHRSAAGRNVHYLLREFYYSKPLKCRSIATTSSGATLPSYARADAAGVKFACRDVAGPTTRLAVIVKAGTRYQPAPGLASGLAAFNFKSTTKRSALRITRESELLGGQLDSRHTHEAVILEAKFMREDLPFFAELLSEVISETRYITHEFEEQVALNLRISQEKQAGYASQISLESAHNVAFHNSLGSLHSNLLSPITKYVNSDTISDFAKSAYAKSNIAIVANGANHAELTRWVGEFFGNISDSARPLSSVKTVYYGGEERIHHPSGNSFVIAFPGSSVFAGASFNPGILVLSALIGGQSSIKWTNGFSLLATATSNLRYLNATTSNFSYSDSGLLAIQLNGSAESVRQASFETFKTLKKVADGGFTEEDLTKAISLAKFRALDDCQDTSTSMMSTGIDLLHNHKVYQVEEIGKAVAGVSFNNLKTVAQDLLSKKATISAVGDLHVLPFAEEVGFKV